MTWIAYAIVHLDCLDVARAEVLKQANWLKLHFELLLLIAWGSEHCKLHQVDCSLAHGIKLGDVSLGPPQPSTKVTATFHAIEAGRRP